MDDIVTQERVLVGMLLNNPKFIDRVISKVKPEYFLENEMKNIYEELINGNTNPAEISRKCRIPLKDIIDLQSIQVFVTKELVDGYGYYIFEQHKKIEISRLLKEEPIDIDAVEQIQKQTFFDEQERDESEEYLKNVEERFSGKTDTRNIPTGFSNIDSKIEGFRNSELIFIGARPGVGKGLTLDTKILTPNGWVENKDVKVGDTLIGRDGKPTKVIGVYPQPLKDCYKITFKDGRSQICDSSHLWSVCCYRFFGKSDRVLSTEELYKKMQAKRYQRRISIPTFSGDYGTEKNFVIHPYIIGVLIGDGCLTSGLRYNKPSLKVLEKVKKYAPPFVTVRVGVRNNVYLNNWSEARKYLSDEKLNVRSYEKFIPQEYFHSSLEQRKLLFEGLMDTDGYFSHGGYEYSTTSKQLADDVMQLAYSLGYNCSISSRMGKYKKDGKVIETRTNYRVHITNIKPLTIDKIEKVDSVPTQCLAVDNEEKLFVIENYIVTHNTTYGMNLAYNMSKGGHKVLFCSLEMGAIELHERLVKSITKITDYREMTSSDFDRIAKTSRAIKERLPLIIYDKAGMTIEDIICKCKDTDGLDVVIIDHLAILKSTKNFKSKYELVSYLTSRLKQLARELDKPVICLCQLNRGLEGRDIKSPTLADARDSGSVEEDGDIVAFIYRPEYHLSQREPDDETSQDHLKWENEMDAVRGKAEFIIAKNRRGYTGKFKFGFDGQTYTFYEREY